jgi:hypothetical protein
MFLSGGQIRIRLDFRLKHAGMTDVGWAIYLTQQAPWNEPLAAQTDRHLRATQLRAAMTIFILLPQA